MEADAQQHPGPSSGQLALNQETQNSASFPTMIQTQRLPVPPTLLSSQAEKLRSQTDGGVRAGASGLPLNPSCLGFPPSWLMIQPSGRAPCSLQDMRGADQIWTMAAVVSVEQACPGIERPGEHRSPYNRRWRQG